MHIDDFYPSQFLKAHDLKGKDAVLTFIRIERREVTAKGGQKKMKGIGYFKELREHAEKTGEEEKRLIMPITVLRQIATALNEKEADKWVGKQITVFGTTCSGERGENVDCVRVRETAPVSKETK